MTAFPPEPLPPRRPRSCRLGPFEAMQFEALDSTSSHARRLAEAGSLATPCVVIAARQTAGRGRHGKRWLSDDHAVTATFCLDVEPTSGIGADVGQRVAVAVAEALERFAPDVRIKWPNDLLIRERKVAGILLERIDRLLLIGIGVNVGSAPPVRDGVGLASTARGPQKPTREAVLAELSRSLERWLVAAPPAEAVRQSWDRRDALRGRKVAVFTDPGAAETLRGIAEGIDEAGRLMVRSDRLQVIARGTVRTVDGGS